MVTIIDEHTLQQFTEGGLTSTFWPKQKECGELSTMTNDNITKEAYHYEADADDGIVAIDQAHLRGKLEETHFALWQMNELLLKEELLAIIFIHLGEGWEIE
jgi:hypothetical protein